MINKSEHLKWKVETIVLNEREILSFLNPKYKEMHDEQVPAMQAIRGRVLVRVTWLGHIWGLTLTPGNDVSL